MFEQFEDPIENLSVFVHGSSPVAKREGVFNFNMEKIKQKTKTKQKEKKTLVQGVLHGMWIRRHF